MSSLLLPPTFTTKSGHRVDTPSRAELDRWTAHDELPISVDRALTANEAAGIALLLPQSNGETGWGLFPPTGAPPILTMRSNVIDVYGRAIRGGARGVLGCMWCGRSSTSPVHVIWLRHDTPRPRMVEVYDSAIASIEVLDGVVPSLIGWQILKL